MSSFLSFFKWFPFKKILCMVFLGLQSLLQTGERKQFHWVVKKSRLLQKVQPGTKFRILTGIWGLRKKTCLEVAGGLEYGVMVTVLRTKGKNKQLYLQKQRLR